MAENIEPVLEKISFGESSLPSFSFLSVFLDCLCRSLRAFFTLLTHAWYVNLEETNKHMQIRVETRCVKHDKNMQHSISSQLLTLRHCGPVTPPETDYCHVVALNFKTVVLACLLLESLSSLNLKR